MWFRMPEMAEKNARIMLVPILPGHGVPLAILDRASDEADRPVIP
jgi:hypothetical protein